MSSRKLVTSTPTTSGKKGRKTTNTAKPKSSTQTSLVPRSSRAVARSSHGASGQSSSVMLAPEGYTMRPVIPAEKYDVVSFARAMNDDFAPRVQKLFQPETEAALIATRKGVYIGWRCPEFKHDCQRVSDMSKCFCGHLLGEHASYTGKSTRVPCRQAGCPCKAFAWIPSRPEDIGEFWFQRRRNFDPTSWRAKCRCKHTHEQHNPVHKRCNACSCSLFDSNFLCAACDRHWEDHDTFFETETMRRQQGLPYGEEYLPFAEMPDLRNACLTGDEYNDSAYLALTNGEGPIPDNKTTHNNMAVKPRSNFNAVYD